MAAAMMHAAGVTALPANLSTGRNLDRNLERVVAEQRKLQELTARDRWGGWGVGVCWRQGVLAVYRPVMCMGLRQVLCCWCWLHTSQ